MGGIFSLGTGAMQLARVRAVDAHPRGSTLPFFFAPEGRAPVSSRVHTLADEVALASGPAIFAGSRC